MKTKQQKSNIDQPVVSGSASPKVCRLLSLNEFNGVLLGRDMSNIFKKGHVYSVVELMGEIMFKDLGEHAIPEYLENKGTINQYFTSGIVFLTKEEYKQQKNVRLNSITHEHS